MTAFAEHLRSYGFAIVPQAFDLETVDGYLAALRELPADDSRGGIRDVFSHAPAMRALACDATFRAPAVAALGPRCFAVRAILFDKTPGSNWKVAWHQDLTIAVQRRAEMPGYGPWSEKAGVPHVQPPAAILDRVVTVRLHLDECGPENGPLRVLPGTHRQGRFTADAIELARAGTAEVVCTVPRGGLLAMHPLVLHASSPATAPGHRRVLHIEYAGVELPAPLEWFERWSPADIAHAPA